MKKLWDLKKVFSNVELEGQRRGIIMEVTRPLLLRLIYQVKWPITPNKSTGSVNIIRLIHNNAIFVWKWFEKPKIHKKPLESAIFEKWFFKFSTDLSRPLRRISPRHRTEATSLGRKWNWRERWASRKLYKKITGLNFRSLNCFR